MFKVAVVGSRNFKNFELMKRKLDSVLRNKQQSQVIIVSGGAKGADSWAMSYASLRGYKKLEIEAEWEKHGRSAGFKRNHKLVNSVDALVAFWDGSSKGTEHSIKLARARSIPVRVFHF